MSISFKRLRDLCMPNIQLETTPMFDKLFSLAVKSASGKSCLEILMEGVESANQVIEHFSEHYSEDHDTYDAAIDTFCQILQEHKSKK